MRSPRPSVRAAATIFAGVFQHRVGQGARQVKALIEAGRFGGCVFGLSETLWQRAQAYYDVWWRGTWEKECGGVTMGHGIHSIDMLAWLMGEPASLIADAATVKLAIEVEDTSLATVRFRSGAIGQIIVTVNAQDNRSRLEIFGDELQAVSSESPYDPTREPFRLTSLDPATAERARDAASAAFPDETKHLHVADGARLRAGHHRAAPAARQRRRVPPLDGDHHRHLQVGDDRRARRFPIAPDDPWYSGIPAEGAKLN